MAEIKCTWEIEGKVDEDGMPTVCNRKLYVTFARRTRVMGQQIRTRYPRCRIHAPDRTIEQAQREGYELLWPQPEEDEDV